MESAVTTARVSASPIDWEILAKSSNAPPDLAFLVPAMENVLMELVSATLDGAALTVTMLRAPAPRSAAVEDLVSKVLVSATRAGPATNVPPRLSAPPCRRAQGPRCVLDPQTACATQSLECASVCPDIPARIVA